MNNQMIDLSAMTSEVLNRDAAFYRELSKHDKKVHRKDARKTEKNCFKGTDTNKGVKVEKRSVTLNIPVNMKDSQDKIAGAIRQAMAEKRAMLR